MKEQPVQNAQIDVSKDNSPSPLLAQEEQKRGETQERLVNANDLPLTQQRYFARVIALVETVLIGAGLIILFQVLPFTIHGDATIRYKALSKWLEHGILPTMKYSIVGPAFSIPLWFLGKVYQDSMWWCERYNIIIFAIGLIVIYLVLRKWFDHSFIRKFILLLVVASMFPAHLANYYSEVFTALCVGIGILVALFSSRFGGWLAVVLGVVNTPASILGLAGVVLKQTLDSKRWRTVAIFAVAVCLLVAESWIRLGHPLNSGYDGNAGACTIMPYTCRSGFSYPFFFGLISILFSFGKGLIYFAPGLLLPIRKTLLNLQSGKKHEIYQAYILWMVFLAGLILIYSRWWAWYGGWFWGPRFFLFASIPASFALAVRLHYRSSSLLLNVLTAVVFCLSAWVGFNVVFYNPDVTVSICYAHHYALEMLCHYTPEFSVLWYPFVIHEPIKAIFNPYVIYSIITFAYLAAPLLGRTVFQAIEQGRDFGIKYLNFKEWQV